MKIKLATMCVALGMGMAGAANAQVVVTPGSQVFNGTPGFMGDSLGGSFSLIASMNQSFVAADPTAFSGTLSSYVVSGDTNNPLHGLDFIYLLGNSSTSTDAMHRLTVNGFDSGLVDAGFLTSGMSPTGSAIGSGLAPSLVDRGSTGDNLGFGFLQSVTISGITTLFPGALNPGTGGNSNFTDYLVLYTAASNYTQNTASVIDGSTANTMTFSPTLAVPEPENYAMMLAGLGLMGFVVRRRSSKSAA